VAFLVAGFDTFSSKKTQSGETESEFFVTLSSVHLPSCWWTQFDEQLIVVIISLLLERVLFKSVAVNKASLLILCP